MAQEFTINSSSIETKINQLLPSQGGSGAGLDFSASTMVIPIVDLTESAEGSGLRLDLQKATDFATTQTIVVNATNTVAVATTGFYQVEVNAVGTSSEISINIFDGASFKNIRRYQFGTVTNNIVDNFLVFLRAGDSLRASSGSTNATLNLFTRQVADVTGNLTNPLGFL